MKISLIQSSIEWMQPERNWNRVEEWISKCCDSTLVVLPEMFTTGFCMESQSIVQKSCDVLERMVGLSNRYGVAIIGSVAVEEGDRCYNRLFCVKPDESYAKYDKRHLFSFAAEDQHFEAGRDRVVVEVGGVRILLLVCYDIRFPVWSRNRGDYDVIVCVANWPESRRQPWDILLRARAIENLSYVCGVNIVGELQSCNYSGGTAAIDFLGNVVSSVADGECGVATINIDMKALRRFRAKFTALEDADNFEIEK